MSEEAPDSHPDDYAYERPLKTNEDVKKELDQIFGKGVKVEEIEPSVVTIQRFARTLLTKRRLHRLSTMYRESDSTKRARLRRLKSEEIVTSEQSYLVGLDNLMRRYYDPMFTLTTTTSGFFSSPLLSEKEHKSIFMNVSLIVEFQRDFYAQLCMEHAKWPQEPSRLGLVFVRFSPFMKLYREYSVCYQKALDTLAACAKRKGFGEWLENVRQANMDCVPLEALLIMPIQRIPRYRMLLEEVIKFTPESHVDYQSLCQALEIIKEIANFVNEGKRSAENMAKVATIQNNLRGIDMNVVHPQRRLLKRGPLIRINSETGAHEHRYFYLFNDLMMATIESNDAPDIRIYDGYFLTRDATVVEGKYKCDFGVKYQAGSTVYYRAHCVEKKNKWMTRFQDGIREISAQAKDQSPDYLLDLQHYGGGTSKKAGEMKIYERLLIRSTTKTRWFVLRNGVLYKQKDPHSKDTQQVFQLENYKIRPNSAEHPDAKFAFELVSPETTHTFVLKSESEKAAWVQALQEVCATIKEPITDLCIIHEDKGDKVPLGYCPIKETYYSHPGSLNADSGGRQIILCYEKGGVGEDNRPKAPITDIAVMFTDSGSLLHRRQPEVLPSDQGWTMIKRTFYDRDTANLNAGQSGRDIFLLYKREPQRPPITRISMYWTVGDENVPPGFTPVDRTVTGNFIANLNNGAGGTALFFCYQRETKEDLFLQEELGWIPHQGFHKQTMSLAWQHYLGELGLSDAQIQSDEQTVLFAVEETLRLCSAMEEKRSGTNRTSCFVCLRDFNYPDNTSKVLCPFCQTVNQCILVGEEPQRASRPPPTDLSKSQIAPYIPAYATFKAEPAPTASTYTPPYLAGVNLNTSTMLPSYVPPYAQTPPPASPAQPEYAPAYLTGVVQVSASTPPASPVPQQQSPMPPPSNPSHLVGQYSYGDIPLGTVPKKVDNEPGAKKPKADFSSMTDQEYKLLVGSVKQRVEQKIAGLEEFHLM